MKINIFTTNGTKKQKEADGLAKHFDCDKVVRILPDEYRKIQKIIGEKFLKLIKNRYN